MRADVITKRNGAQQGGAAGPLALTHRQRRRYDGAARMAQRGRVRIIGFVGVPEHAVGQRGSGRGGDDAAAGDDGLFVATQRFGIGDCFATRQQARAGDHRGQRVEHMVFGFFQHCPGQRFARCPRDIGADFLHDR